MGLSDDETAHLPRYSKKRAADIFRASVSSLNHASNLFGSQSRAIPELRQAAEQGLVTVSDACKVALQPREVQLRAPELVQSGSAGSIAAAAVKALQDIDCGAREDEPEPVLPGRQAVSEALERSGLALVPAPLRDLHEWIEAESVDAIVANPTISARGLATLPDLAALAGHALKPTGVTLVLATGEHLKQYLDRLETPDMELLGEVDILFSKKWSHQRGRHPQTLRRRPLLVYGKWQAEFHPGGDMIWAKKSEGPERESRATRELDLLIYRIVRRYTVAGQVVLDPAMLGRPTVAMAALRQGRAFIGADSDQPLIELVRRRLAMEKLGGAATRQSPGPGSGVQRRLPLFDTNSTGHLRVRSDFGWGVSWSELWPQCLAVARISVLFPD